MKSWKSMSCKMAYRKLIRLYLSKTSPFNNFPILVNYVARVYVPMWPKLQVKTSITEGSRHRHELIPRIRFLQ